MKNKEKATGFINAIERKNIKAKIVYWAMFAFLVIVSLICILPPIWIFVSSFKDTAEFLSLPPTLLPKHVNLSKLAAVWTKASLGKAYIATCEMVVGDLFFCLTICCLAGYMLSRLKPKGHKILFTIIFWTMLLPTSMNMVPLFATFVDFPILHVNLTDSFLPMWIMSGANAFNILLFKSFFDSISISYLEAARIDGCSEFGIFSKIILPLSKPIVMTVSIFTVNATWGSFLWPYLLIKKTNMKPLGVVVYGLKDLLSVDEYMMSLIFVIVPPVIFFLLFQKYIMEGMMIGGIKG